MKNKVWIKPAVWGIYLLVLAGSGFYSFNAVRTFTQTWQITDLGPGFSFRNPTPTPAAESEHTPVPGQPTPTPLPASELSNYQPWDGSDRVTILIMGLDYRDWEAGEGAPRTDTMMLLTIDPLSNTAGMLSIPRDLYVSIPGFQYGRINTAYREGEVYQLPGGGPALAVKTVEQLLGIEIDFYAQIDFYTFERMIDEIGGLKVDIKEPIKVDPIGDKPPKVLQPGRQTLPGDLALAYVRARNTEGGDFDRAQRQQEVIVTLRDDILNRDLIPLLLKKAPVLYAELSEGVNTNMTLEQAIRLGLLAKDIPAENIRQGIIGTDSIIFWTTPEGDQVLKPLPDKIRQVRDYVFGTADLSSPLAGLSDEERVQAENAKILVLNGTFTAGLAANTAEYLNSLGFNVPPDFIGDAQEAYTFTTIFDYTGNPYTVQMLAEILNVQSNRVYLRYNPDSKVDVEVNLGSDWAGNNPLP